MSGRVYFQYSSRRDGKGKGPQLVAGPSWQTDQDGPAARPLVARRLEKQSEPTEDGMARGVLEWVERN